MIKFYLYIGTYIYNRVALIYIKSSKQAGFYSFHAKLTKY